MIAESPYLCVIRDAEQMPRRLTLNELPPHSGGESSYRCDPGFSSGYWNNESIIKATSARNFVFTAEGREVTRVLLFQPAQIAAEYVGFDRRIRAIEIVRIETRVDSRRGGCGREAVGILREAFPQMQFVLFSDADEFWCRIGFHRATRIDGDARIAPLYVAPAICETQKTDPGS